ncbi:unnamed protein product [Allacma fusca]|uniref:non-specific serine/threonine protein kinase n=1 Tax=Allacma fusca TaxID=39272 RepID=A0A8J2PGU8_9HEXA|nr:unnamed protein product [Allacma fusca]
MEFIEEWFIEQTLGEGAFGEVKLLVNKKTKDEVALKIINLQLHPDAADTVRKEVQIHKLLDHDNIIRFYGSRKEGPIEYIFLEYASGGELFDRIEPDCGMDANKAQNYFQQLINGVDYLHKLGIAHRDLKPENILLDGSDRIKISDFGFATVFRIRGRDRLLDKRCGTLPYVAPEVLKGNYKAPPADIWSCGIILVALLAGELPWDKPSNDCHEFMKWKTGDMCCLPWTKLDIKALSFVKRLLCPSAGRRITMDLIMAHPWLSKKSSGLGTKGGYGIQLAKKIASGLNLSGREDDSIIHLCLSQPEARKEDEVDCHFDQSSNDHHRRNPIFSFSQPAGERVDDFFIGSQLGSQAANTQSPPITRWVKRLTRFCVTTTLDKTIHEVTEILDDIGFQWKLGNSSGPCITVSTVDKRKNLLVFKAHVIEMGNRMVLLDFRLSRGDGLEFKRNFVRLRERLSKIEWKGPMTWVM